MDSALKAIAEPRRRQILRLVWGREMAAGEIAEHFEVSRPAISQHLRVLKEADLVSERRQGTRRLYRTRRSTIEDLQQFLDEYWSTGLSRLRDVAEAAEEARRSRDTPDDSSPNPATTANRRRTT